MPVIQIVNVNLSRSEITPKISAVQNDTGRSVRMTITDHTLQAGYTGRLYFSREDRTKYSEPATLELANNSFLADLTRGITIPGTTECQLAIRESSAQDAKIVSTYMFKILVQRSTVGDNPEEQAVWDYPWPGSGNVGPLTATENGVYYAYDDELDGYDVVTVALPNANGVSF